MNIGLQSNELEFCSLFIWIQPQIKRWGARWQVERVISSPAIEAVNKSV